MSVITEEKKQEERVKAQQYADLTGAQYVDPFPAADTSGDDGRDKNLDEISDDALIELLNKRAGITLANLDDLKPKPTEEQIAAQQKERESSMLSFGLSSGKFKKEEYDAYQLALSNKKDLVRSGMAEQLQAAFPELDEDAINEKVANYFFEHLDETDPLRIAREKEVVTLSDLQIKNKYSNIVNLPNDYAQHEEGLNNKANFERKIQATLPVYTSDVKTALQSLRHFNVEIPDTHNPANNVTVTLEYDDKDLKEVEDLFLTSDQIVRAVKSGVTIEQIKGEAKMVLVEKHLSRLISQAAKKYNTTQKDGYIQGRKGLSNGSDLIGVSDDKLGDTLEDVYNQFVENENAKR